MISIALAFSLLGSQSSPAREMTISPSDLKATVVKLASWPTRNTSSPEIYEAAKWIADQYRQIPGMKVELMVYPIEKGPRVPEAKEAVQVIATLPATVGVNDVQSGAVLMGGHFDTINMQADPLKGRAPGANDDGSGVAATLAVAKALAGTKHSHPYIFVAFSGEEQGLFGSTALAARFAHDSVPLEAVLSNDMIGNSADLSGQSDAHHVRIFSEESPRHQGRELARWIEWLQRTSGTKDLRVKLVFRPDRFGRGGDHTPFNKQDYTAIRVVDMFEEYSRQHTEKDLPEGMDFDYLARNARLNLLAMTRLGNAGPPPTRVREDRRQNHDSLITWQATPGVRYRVYWRDPTDPTWTHSKLIGTVDHIEFKLLSKDENVFAIGAEGGIPVIAN